MLLKVFNIFIVPQMVGDQQSKIVQKLLVVTYRQNISIIEVEGIFLHRFPVKFLESNQKQVSIGQVGVSHLRQAKIFCISVYHEISELGEIEFVQ